MSLLEENAEPAKCKQLSLLWLIIRANSIIKGQSLQQKTRGRGVYLREGPTAPLRREFLVCLQLLQVWEVAAPLGSPAHWWYGQECRQVTTNSRKRSYEGLQTSPAFKIITEPQLCFSVNLLIFSFAHSWERQMWKLTINTYRGLMPLLSPKSSAVSFINTLCFFINIAIPHHRKLLSERVKIHIQTLSFTSRNGTSRHALTGTPRRGQVTPSGWNPLHTRTHMLIKCWFQPRSQRSRIFAFQQYEINKVKLSC